MKEKITIIILSFISITVFIMAGIYYWIPSIKDSLNHRKTEKRLKQLELKLKKCEQIKLIPHCSEREIILFKDVIDKCFIERD